MDKEFGIGMESLGQLMDKEIGIGMESLGFSHEADYL
jgi:hypothetical protein